MIGHSADIAVARAHNSTVGIWPENPAMSQPQNGTPLTPAVSPAVIEARKASQVESSSPAQWHGTAPAPVKPARLKVTPSVPVRSISSWYALAYWLAYTLLVASPREPSW